MWLGLLVLAVLGCAGKPPVEVEMEDEVVEQEPEDQDPVLKAHLDALNGMVDQWVEAGAVVGAEYVIIEKGKVLLHEARGMRDREAGLPMQRHTIFQVQSMTKPILATGVLLLVSEGVLDLDDRVSHYLSSFSSNPVTIRQLLHRTDGFTQNPFSSRQYATLEDLVDALGRLGPDVAPGTVFSRNTTDTWTLGGVVQAVTEMPEKDFLWERVLSEVGMTVNTYREVGPDDPWRPRMSAVYERLSSGQYQLVWSTDDPDRFRNFAGGGGIYTTPMEYAKFLTLWMNKGRIGSKQFIPESLVEEALILEPLSVQVTTSYGQTPYGMHWDLGPGILKPGTGVASFGHPGGDGTIGWVVPEKELIILYFTQSRKGTTHFLFVEEAIRRLAQ